MDRSTLLSRVRSILEHHVGSFRHADDGQFEVSADSTVCRIGVVEQPSGRTLVYVTAFILKAVPATAEVFEYVALHTNDWIFGHLCADREVGGLVLSMRHTLLGETLDPDELLTAVIDLSAVANQLDDELQSRFGGLRWID